MVCLLIFIYADSPLDFNKEKQCLSAQEPEKQRSSQRKPYDHRLHIQFTGSMWYVKSRVIIDICEE